MSERAACLNNSTFSWTFNSANVSPCDVTKSLGSVCEPTYFLGALQPGQSYLGPRANQTTPCRCSSVLYSMLSACAYCQGAPGVLKWSTYNANCTQVFVPTFPLPIPANTRVPAWAYINVTIEDGFDPVVAQAANNNHLPDSTSIPTATPTSSSVANPTPAIQKSDMNKKNQDGIIAGGTVGGFVFLCLVSCIAVWFVKKKNRRSQQEISNFDTPVTQTYIGTPITPFTPTKLYDPNDSSTFPQTFHERNRHASSPLKMSFTGAPEIA